MNAMVASRAFSICCLPSSYQQSPCASQAWLYQVNPVAFSNTLKVMATAFVAMKSCEATVGAWERYQKLSSENMCTAQALPSQLGHRWQISKTKEAIFHAPLPDLVRVQTLVQGVEIAEVFVKTVKVAGLILQWLQTPALLGSVDGIVLGYKTAKVAVKGVKVSKGVLRIMNMHGNTLGNSFAPLLRILRYYKMRIADSWRLLFGIKASMKAWETVKLSISIAKEVFRDQQACLVDWGVLAKSWKVSENLMSVVEALSAIQGGMLSAVSRAYKNIKRTFQGLTFMVKAVTVSKDILILLLSGYGMLRGALKAFSVIFEQCEGNDKITIISDCGRKIILLAFVKNGRSSPKSRLHSTFGMIKHLLARHSADKILEYPVVTTSLCAQSAHLSALLSVYQSLSSMDPSEFCSSSNTNPVYSTFPSSSLLSLSYPIL